MVLLGLQTFDRLETHMAMGRVSQPTRQCPRSDREPDVLKPVLERLSPHVFA
jgi:hypothetical protein